MNVLLRRPTGSRPSAGAPGRCVEERRPDGAGDRRPDGEGARGRRAAGEAHGERGDGFSQSATPGSTPVASRPSSPRSAALLYDEHRATGLRSMPRLSMALGLTLLSASFLVASPLKCYVAYGFSHAVEYVVVFVWAFQRRRFAVPLEPRPLLQRR